MKRIGNQFNAVIVKYLPGSSTKGGRLKATCSRGSITIDYPHELNRDQRYEAAFRALVDKFVKQDEKRGIPKEKNGWANDYASGALPDGSEVFVYI